MDKNYIVDLTGTENRTELHDRVQEGIPVPEWYGRNLDALFDILTEPEFKDSLICFIGCADFRYHLPKYLEALQHMCDAAMEVNPGLIVEFVD